MSSLETKLQIILDAKNTSGPAFQALQASLLGLGSVMQHMTEMAKGLVGAYLGFDVVRRTVEGTFEALNRFSQTARLAGNYGMPAAEFSKLESAAQASGLEVEQFRTGLDRFSKALSEAQVEGSATAEIFKALGVATRDTTTGGIRPIKDALLDTAQAFAKYATDANKVHTAQQLFGRSGSEFINLLNKGRAGVEDLGAELVKIGGAVTERDVRIAKEYRAEMRGLKEELEASYAETARMVGPWLTKAIATYRTLAFGSTAYYDLAYKPLRADTVEREKPGMAPPLDQRTKEVDKMATDYQRQLLAVVRAQKEVSDAMMLRNPFLSQQEIYQRQRLMASGEIYQLKKERADLQQEIRKLEDEEFQLKSRIEDTQWTPASEDQRLQLLAQRYKVSQRLHPLQRQELGLQVRQIEAEKHREEIPNPSNLLDQIRAKSKEAVAAWGTMAQQMAMTLTGTVTSAVQGLSQALTGVIMGTQNAAQAFGQFALSMATSFIASVIQMVLMATIAMPILTALSVVGAGVPAAQGAAVTATALGAAASMSASVVGRAEGGIIPGSPSRSDNRLAAVATGEYIVRSAAVQHYGAALFAGLNEMRLPAPSLDGLRLSSPSLATSSFAAGGLVVPVAGPGPAPLNIPPAQVHVIQVHSQQALFDALTSITGQKIVLGHVYKNKPQLGIRS